MSPAVPELTVPEPLPHVPHESAVPLFVRQLLETSDGHVSPAISFALRTPLSVQASEPPVPTVIVAVVLEPLVSALNAVDALEHVTSVGAAVRLAKLRQYWPVATGMIPLMIPALSKSSA